MYVVRSGVFIVNFEQISHIALVSLLLTLDKHMPAGDECSNMSAWGKKNINSEKHSQKGVI